MSEDKLRDPCAVLEAMSKAAARECSAGYVRESATVKGCVTVDGEVDFPLMIRAALRAAEQAGWRLVPIEATAGMIEGAEGWTAWASVEREEEALKRIYVGMIGRAPIW